MSHLRLLISHLLFLPVNPFPLHFVTFSSSFAATPTRFPSLLCSSPTPSRTDFGVWTE